MSHFIVDFYCAKARLVIEVDGGVHEEPLVMMSMTARENVVLAELGLRVLRFKT